MSNTNQTNDHLFLYFLIILMFSSKQYFFATAVASIPIHHTTSYLLYGIHYNTSIGIHYTTYTLHIKRYLPITIQKDCCVLIDIDGSSCHRTQQKWPKEHYRVEKRIYIYPARKSQRKLTPCCACSVVLHLAASFSSVVVCLSVSFTFVEKDDVSRIR